MEEGPKPPLDKRSTEIVTDVQDCIRCGGNHSQIKFSRLSNSPKGITHWGMCPTKKQPILKNQGWE